MPCNDAIEAAGQLQYCTETKSRLDTSDVVLVPVGLGGFLLTNWYTLPLYTHDRHSINIVLIKPYRQGRVVSRRPLCKSPFLDDVCGFLELGELSTDVSAEELECAARLCACPVPWWGPRERSDALRVCEGLIEVGRICAELCAVGDGSYIDNCARAALLRAGCFRLGAGLVHA